MEGRAFQREGMAYAKPCRQNATLADQGTMISWCSPLSTVLGS